MRRDDRRPRSGWVRVLVGSFLLLGGWSALILAASALLEVVGQGSFLGSGNLPLAVICALVAGLFLAAFLLRREAITMPVENVDDFLHRARRVLENLGCVVENQGPHSLIGRPRFLSFLLGGNFRLEVQAGLARLVGPRAWIDSFPKRLRWDRHLEVSAAAATEIDRFHKRVRLRLTLQAHALEDFLAEVLLPLRRHGEGDFSLDLLVQSPTGISDRFLDAVVRPWLGRSTSSPLLQFDLVHRLPPGADAPPPPPSPAWDPVPGTADTSLDRG